MSVSEEVALAQAARTAGLAPSIHNTQPWRIDGSILEHGVHHLVVTDMIGQPIGVVRVADLARTEVRDPLLVRRRSIRPERSKHSSRPASRCPSTLAELRAQGVPARYVGSVHAAVVDAIFLRALVVCAPPITPQVRCSWMLLGPMARQEPLPRSDLATALMWADPEPSTSDPAAEVRGASGHVLDCLSQCGLERMSQRRQRHQSPIRAGHNWRGRPRHRTGWTTPPDRARFCYRPWSPTAAC